MDYFPRKSLSKYLITDTIDFNKHVHDIDIFINVKMTSGENTWAVTQGDLNFAFDQRESDVNLHKATSSPSNVSPDATYNLEERQACLLHPFISCNAVSCIQHSLSLSCHRVH